MLGRTSTCRDCKKLGVSRYNCPGCPCLFCSKNGHCFNDCYKRIQSQQKKRMVEAQRKVDEKMKGLEQMKAKGCHPIPKPGDCGKCLMTSGNCVCASLREPQTIREIQTERKRDRQFEGEKVFTSGTRSQTKKRRRAVTIAQDFEGAHEDQGIKLWERNLRDGGCSQLRERKPGLRNEETQQNKRTQKFMATDQLEIVEGDVQELSYERRREGGQIEKIDWNRFGSDEEESKDPESDINEEVSSILFPDLVQLFRRMIEVICSLESDELLKVYRRFIDEKLDKSQLPEMLSGCINYQVANLQGQRVNASSLQKIRECQTRREHLFHGPGGYLNFITDDRDPKYYKMYVGQSVNVIRRIGRHAMNFSRGEKSCLHYYIYALGEGHRRFHFIRLFHTPTPEQYRSVPTKEDQGLIMSLLELGMGLAFQSLPKNTCEMFLDTSLEKGTMHLNVLNPLWQMQTICTEVRRKARNDLATSDDLEIRSWPEFREQMMSSTHRSRTKLPTFQDLESKVLSAIKEVCPGMDSNSLKDAILRVETFQAKDFDLDAALERSRKIIGSICKVDVVLGQAIGNIEGSVMVIYGEPDNSTLRQQKLPFKLARTGLNTWNSLVWSLDFGFLNNDISPTHLERLDLIKEQLDALSEEILIRSSATVVLLCGTYSQQFLSNAGHKIQVSKPLHVKLQGEIITIRVERQKDDLRIRRIYIDAPELYTVCYGCSFARKKRMSTVLKLVSIFQDKSLANHRFYEIWTIQGEIWGIIVRTRNGDKIPFNSFSENVADWFREWGFGSPDDMRALERASKGCLGAALQTIYVALSKLEMPGNRSSINFRKPNINWSDSKMASKDTKEAIANLLYKKIEARHKRLLRLSNTEAGSRAAEIKKSEIEEDLKGMRLEQINDEHTESSVSASSVEGQIMMDSQEQPYPLMSNTLDLNTPEDEYNFKEVDSNKQSEILQKQIRAINHRRSEKLWLSKMKKTVDQYKDQGKTFDEIFPLFPTISVGSIRKAYYSTGVSSGGSTVRGPPRAFKMFEKNEGVLCHSADLRLLGQYLNWQFEPQHNNQGIQIGLAVRVWIKFFTPGEGTPRPWYQEESDPILSTFVFKVALGDQGFEDSLTLYPRIQGYEKLNSKRPTGGEAAEKKALARKIVDLHEQWAPVKRH